MDHITRSAALSPTGTTISLGKPIVRTLWMQLKDVLGTRESPEMLAARDSPDTCKSLKSCKRQFTDSGLRVYFVLLWTVYGSLCVLLVPWRNRLLVFWIVERGREGGMKGASMPHRTRNLLRVLQRSLIICTEMVFVNFGVTGWQSTRYIDTPRRPVHLLRWVHGVTLYARPLCSSSIFRAI